MTNLISEARFVLTSNSMFTKPVKMFITTHPIKFLRNQFISQGMIKFYLVQQRGGNTNIFELIYDKHQKLIYEDMTSYI